MFAEDETGSREHYEVEGYDDDELNFRRIHNGLSAARRRIRFLVYFYVQDSFLTGIRSYQHPNKRRAGYVASESVLRAKTD
jgi:hypothetical protein